MIKNVPSSDSFPFNSLSEPRGFARGTTTTTSDAAGQN